MERRFNNVLAIDSKIEIKRSLINSSSLHVVFEDFIAAICAGLDVSVYYSENTGPETLVHQNIEESDFDIDKWLNKISFSKYQTSPNVQLNIIKAKNRVRPIIENDKILGLAAISTQVESEQNFLGINTVGGLASSIHSREGSLFIGFIDYLPDSAKREGHINYTATEGEIKKWAQRQLELLTEMELNVVERYIAASNLCHFNVDPIDIATVPVSVNGQIHFLSFDILSNLIGHTRIAFLTSSIFRRESIDSFNEIQSIPGFALIKAFRGNNFNFLKVNGGIPENNNSILDCLHRTVIKAGKSPVYEYQKTDLVSRYGEKYDLLIVSV